MIKVDNAIIMAAGTASRFAPLSYEIPKSLLKVKGEILIERQIRQLQEAGIPEIYIVVGYKKELFQYLEDKMHVQLIENSEFLTRNNNASIHAVRHLLKNSYICSSDNYFTINPFEAYVDESYYATVYADGPTDEWCMFTDEQGYINRVDVGGRNAWYMMGHTFWSENFSKKFLEILEEIYEKPETANLYWENIFMQHMDVLKMKIRHYKQEDIFEFDSLDDLRAFDDTFINHTGSSILRDVAARLHCTEGDIRDIQAYKTEDNAAAGFLFRVGDRHYQYAYGTKHFEERG